jgi:hypothetical protein
LWPVACGPHWPRLPPPASLAPIGLACPHGEEEGSALVLGIGLRLWQSALGFPSLSFIYKSIVFLLFGSTDNSSSSLLLHHHLVSTVQRFSVVNRPVRPELGRNGAVFFEAGRGRTEGTAVDGKFPSPAVPGGHRPTSIDDLRVIIHNRYSVIISTFLHYLDCEARSFNICSIRT